MSRPKRTEAELQWRRERVVEAAVEVFQHTPFSDVTMEQIARHAGYSPAALYLYFRSKDEILATAIERHSHQMAAVLDEPVPPGLTFEQVFRFRIRRARDAAMAQRWLLVLLEDFQVPAGFPLSTAVSKRCLGEGVARWANLMADGVAQGALRADLPPHYLALAWMGLVRSILAAGLSQLPNDEFLAISEAVVDLFLNGARKQ